MPTPTVNETLMWALIEENTENVRRALKRGADIHLRSPTGSCPLHVAALRGSAPIIRILVDNNATVDQPDDDGFTPLMVAALNGKTDAVRELLQKGADPDRMRLDTGETALHLAMNGGSQGVVRALLEGGADINVRTTTNMSTPLHFAAEFNAHILAEVLLGDPRCEGHMQDNYGRTAADVARESGHHRLAQHLDMSTTPRSEVDQKLVSAVLALDERAAREALEDGANVNLHSPTGTCLLHAAALRGSVPIIRLLLENHASVDQADVEGYTPLMVAALNGRTDAVTVLLANCADLNRERLNTGETTLHLAMYGRSEGVVRALLEGGADINAQTTTDKFTPLHFAEQLNARDLADLLREHPLCKHDMKDRKDRIPSELAEEPRHETPDPSDGNTIRVITGQPVAASQSVYKVTSSPRGAVLILSYEKFMSTDREGGEKDVENLKDLFTQMGYRVFFDRDLSYQKTLDTLNSFCVREELRQVDCAVVCVLSHGTEEHVFITSDEKQLPVGQVYDYFTDDCCPNLKGKPKLFLFNFCRGSYIQAGCLNDPVHKGSKADRESTIISGSGNTTVPSTQKTTKAVLKDRITIYASVGGISALRDAERGTFFVLSICKIFAALAHILDVEELAKRVNVHMVNEMRGTTTSTVATITKKFYLNPTPPDHSQ